MNGEGAQWWASATSDDVCLKQHGGDAPKHNTPRRWAREAWDGASTYDDKGSARRPTHRLGLCPAGNQSCPLGWIRLLLAAVVYRSCACDHYRCYCVVCVNVCLKQMTRNENSSFEWISREYWAEEKTWKCLCCNLRRLQTAWARTPTRRSGFRLHFHLQFILFYLKFMLIIGPGIWGLLQGRGMVVYPTLIAIGLQHKMSGYTNN